MKRPWQPALFSILAFALPLFAQEEEVNPFDDDFDDQFKPKEIRVLVENIEVPLPELAKLLAEPSKSTDDTALRAAVQALVDAGTAKLHNCEALIARPGETATTEGVMEYIYPTEYEPAEVPNEITIDGQKLNPAILTDIATPPTPTAFETRNTGSVLEIQPNIGAEETIIDLRFSPELVQHLRNHVWAEWNGPHGRADLQMPIFFSNRTNTGLTLHDGQPLLASTTSMPGEDGQADHQRKLLTFVRADVLVVGK